MALFFPDGRRAGFLWRTVGACFFCAVSEEQPGHDAAEQCGDQSDRIEQDAECVTAEQGGADGADEKGGAGIVAKGQQMGQLPAVQPAAVVQADGGFCPDRKAAQRSQKHGNAPLSPDAEKPPEGAGKQFSHRDDGAAGDDQLGEHHERKKRGDDGGHAQLQPPGHAGNRHLGVTQDAGKTENAHKAERTFPGGGEAAGGKQLRFGHGRTSGGIKWDRRS